METAISVVLLLISLGLVIKGGDVFVESSTDLAKRMKIPQIVFGATFVSLATTLAELLVAILSSVDGTTGLAVGNAVGSAICNIGLVMGIAFVFKPSQLKKSGVIKYYLLLCISLFVFVVGFWFQITAWQGILLLALTIVFFAVNIIDTKTYEKNYPQKDKEVKLKRPLWLSIILFFGGAGAIGGGAYLLVNKVEYLAQVVGVSEQFVGLTVIAIGTSLPELTTILNSIKNNTPSLAIGNIIGSNILNLTLILGIARVVAFDSFMPITKETAYISLPVMLVLTFVMVVPMLIKNKTYRWQGFTFLGVYVLYIAWLIANAVLNIL